MADDGKGKDNRVLYKKKMRAEQENDPQEIDKSSTEISSSRSEVIPENKDEKVVKIEKIVEKNDGDVKLLGERVDKIEKEIPPIKEDISDLKEKVTELGDTVASHEKGIGEIRKIAQNALDRSVKNEKEIDVVRSLAQEALRLCKYAVQWWWPLLVAVLGIVALIIFTFANIFFAILTISAVVITVITAIVSWYYFHYKPNQE
ncbi:MAG: hypothetical protein WA063_00525 [Minisyncoccia bacterium]